MVVVYNWMMPSNNVHKLTDEKSGVHVHSTHFIVMNLNKIQGNNVWRGHLMSKSSTCVKTIQRVIIEENFSEAAKACTNTALQDTFMF